MLHVSYPVFTYNAVHTTVIFYNLQALSPVFFGIQTSYAGTCTICVTINLLSNWQEKKTKQSGHCQPLLFICVDLHATANIHKMMIFLPSVLLYILYLDSINLFFPAKRTSREVKALNSYSVGNISKPEKFIITVLVTNVNIVTGTSTPE